MYRFFWPCTVSLITGVGRSARVTLALSAACVITASPAWPQSRINAVRVVSESARELVLDVDYTYASERGGSVFIGAHARSDGKSSSYIGYRPGPVEQGQNRTRVTLGAIETAPGWFTTSALLVQMYVGGGDPLASAEYSFPKAWHMPQVGLPTLLRPDGGGGGRPAAGATGAMNNEVVERRVAADGSVELVYGDGTIKRKYKGGYTIVKPNGQRSSVQFVSAQPPTPPQAPPDDVHRAWVKDESDRLLELMRALVGGNETTIQNYLGREPADLSDYGRISSRTQAIQWMFTP